MVIRLVADLGSKWRAGDVVTVAEDVGRYVIGAGAAIEVPPGDTGAAGPAHGSDILMPEGRPGEADPRPPAGQ